MDTFMAKTLAEIDAQIRALGIQINGVDSNDVVDFVGLNPTNEQHTQAHAILHAGLFYRLLLTSDKASIVANGSDTATVTVQLQSMESGSAVNVLAAETVEVMVDGDMVAVNLNASGLGTITLTAVETGTIVFEPATYDGNTLSIGAT